MAFGLIILYIVVAIIIVPTVSFIFIFYVRPHYLVMLGIRAQQLHAGMKTNYVGDENLIFCYGERGRPHPDRPTIVCLHPFSANKEYWIPIIKHFPKAYHLIALDLPGHGSSSVPDEKVELNFDFAVEAIHSFLDLAGLLDKKICLVGCSVGGAAAGLYARKYPETLEKLVMICPATDSPVASPFQADISDAFLKAESKIVEKCLILPQDVQDMRRLLSEAAYHSENLLKVVPDRLIQGLLHLVPNKEFLKKFFTGFAHPESLKLLSKEAPYITVPTQLIWGKNDNLMDVSGAENLKSRLPNCWHMELIDKCGHAVDIDQPEAVTKSIMKFVMEHTTDENHNDTMPVTIEKDWAQKPVATENDWAQNPVTLETVC